MTASDRIPVTVLTGVLGAGKTTLLNRILDEHHGQRIAVIENELGEIDIDQALVIRVDEELFEINHGSICCTVRGDLIRVLGSLVKRRDRFARIVVETTGMADPGPVAQTFLIDDEVQAEFRLDGIVTLVDARHLELHLGQQPEAHDQVAFADVIVLNKIDLVDAAKLDELERRLQRINALARVVRGSHGDVPLASVLEVGGFDRLPEYPVAAAGPDAVLAQHVPDEVSSVGLEFDRPFDETRLDVWFGRLLRERGNDIFRMKGILAIAGSDRRFVFHGVHMLLDGRPGAAWGERPQRSQVVFVGRGLDRAALREGLASCLA